MYLYFIIVCNLLEHNVVNVLFVSCCHLVNTNENDYNHCYCIRYCQAFVPKFRSNGLVTLTLSSKWSPESPMSWFSLVPNFNFLCPLHSQVRVRHGTDKTDRQRWSQHNANDLRGQRRNKFWDIRTNDVGLHLRWIEHYFLSISHFCTNSVLWCRR